MSFIFKIKETSTAIDITVTRALLALAAIVTLVYRTNEQFLLNIIIALLLLAGSFFIPALLLRFRINKLLLVSAASVLLLIATHSIVFAVLLVAAAAIIQYLYKQPIVRFDNEGVEVKRMIGGSLYDWDNFSNIVLKDGILTIDFKNNKLLQLDIEEKNSFNEIQFNDFCDRQITQ